MSDNQDADRAAQLRALDEKIARAKKTEAAKTRSEESHSQAEMAWRMVIELVAGVLIGFGMGYGLDWLFGTLPIFLVIFTLLGFAAGVRVMMRTATEAQNGQPAPVADTDEEKDLTRGDGNT